MKTDEERVVMLEARVKMLEELLTPFAAVGRALALLELSEETLIYIYIGGIYTKATPTVGDFVRLAQEIGGGR